MELSYTLKKDQKIYVDPPSAKPVKEYRVKRRAEYPPLEDQLDAIWKGGEDMEAMRQQIMAIKEKYSKE